MRGIEGRVSGTTAFIVLFLGALILGFPSFNPANHHMNPVGDATAPAGNRVLTLGWPGFTISLTTLNPMLATTSSEYMTIWPCYSYLFTRDIDAKLIGDLVESYSVSPDEMTWDMHLITTARFFDKNDPEAIHSLTGADVIYTYWLVQNQSGNRLQHYFPVVNGTPIIQSMWTEPSDAYHLFIRLSSLYAPILNSLSVVPILPQYIWSARVWNWDNFDHSPLTAPVIGSGPFHYALDRLPTTGVVNLGRSPIWFAIEEYGWQMRIDNLIIKTEVSEAANLEDFLAGNVDIMMKMTPSQFLNETVPGVRFGLNTGFVYEYNLNQMTDALRTQLGGAWARGSNNQMLLDTTVKLAMAMCVDKQSFIDTVLQGLGGVADSLVPEVNPWHYSYPDPITFDPAAARQLLWDAGWRYDALGNLVDSTSAVYPLCKIGGTEPLQFRFVTLDTAPEWDVGARRLATWASMGGIDLWADYSTVSVDSMNNAWATADYDVWLWDWIFSPTSEVSIDIMCVLTTEAIGSWSDVFYSNTTYDSIYEQSLQEVDPVARRVLTDELQVMAYEDMGCQPVAYKMELYAASDQGPDHWSLVSYGDWEEHSVLAPDQLYPWLYMQIEPADNPAPAIAYLPSSYETTVDTPAELAAYATDNTPLEYRWNFGDGTGTDWSSDSYASHLYANDGYYDAYFVVRERDSTDGFMSWGKVIVSVIGPNGAPHDLDFTYVPSDPNTGDVVQFSGIGADDEADPLAYHWTFGDGRSASGQNVTHQFSDGAASYTVTMYVDDGHLGQVPRPVSYARVVPVTLNSPPAIDVPDFYILRNVPYNFTITSSDPNPRDDLRYTWDWDDGSALQVTTVNHAVHTYSQVSIFTLTVCADDLTGLPGHNVSDQGLVRFRGIDHAPMIAQFLKNVMSVVTGEEVIFTGTATDLDDDLCIMRFDFGDGTNTTVMQLAPNATVFVSHTYTAGGPMMAYLYAFDGILTTQSSGMAFSVGTTFTLSLATGWNLVTVPRVGFGYMASTLGLTNGDTVSTWNSTTKTYKNYIVGVPVNDFSILPGVGYWINVPSGNRTLTLQGSIPTITQYITVLVPEGGGWAVVGFNSLRTDMRAADMALMYNIAESITTVSKWNPATKSYTSWLSIIPAINNFLLVPGQGYWIMTSSSGVLAYDPQ
jgi:ABC-type transport system substrate-binding protein